MLIAFGYDANTVEQADHVIQRELEVVFPAISRRIFAIFRVWRYIQMPSDRRLNRALVKVCAWLNGLLTDARARLKAEPERAQRPSNFIEAMLVAVDESGKPFSDDVIMSNLITMLLAGEDTTAFTLAWTVHQLCDSPLWEAKLRSEADAVIVSANVAVDLDTANKLAVASAVANETMRLRPVAPFLSILSQRGHGAGGYSSFRREQRRCSPLRPPALDQTNFVDPFAFRPERWLEEVSGPQNVSTHIPFGSGPRMCPGRSLALLEMKTFLSMLYKNFDVERVGASTDVSELFGFTMSPAGLKVRLHPSEHSHVA